jgi:glutathione synthase/RimK-type ligase-like ATP-grasp enzyme
MSLHHFNLVFARYADGPPPCFVCLLEREARARGMIFFHCRNHDQAETLRFALNQGTLRIDCLVDYMGRSFRHDYELGCAVKDSGGLVLDDPDRVKIYGDKAVMHQELARAGLELPRTLIWRPQQPSRALTPAERGLLGPRIVCKPAGGSGSGGVVLNMAGTRAALDDARDYDPDDHYLLQEFVAPLELDGRPAWFRVYNCFGRIFACFWHPETHATSLVTPAG